MEKSELMTLIAINILSIITVFPLIHWMIENGWLDFALRLK